MSGVQILKRNTPDSPALTCPAYKFKISNLQYVLQKSLVIHSHYAKVNAVVQLGVVVLFLFFHFKNKK